MGEVEPVKLCPLVLDVEASGFDGTILGVDQIDLLHPGRGFEHTMGQIAPAAAKIGQSARQAVWKVFGEQCRTVVDPIPTEDTGLAEPASVAHWLWVHEATPIVRRRPAALHEPEDAAVELRQRSREAENLAGLLLEARGAVFVGASANKRAAVGQ